MLGLVFTEFLEMVEARFSPALADTIIVQAAPPHGGAYTAVGYYPHEEMLALVKALSEQTGQPLAELVGTFGEHLFGRFVSAYPQMFGQQAGLFDFLESVDGEIHHEVRKLYPGAQLPRFYTVRRSATELELAYESPRGMEALATGLIRGAAAHFGEPVSIRFEPADPVRGQAACFQISRLP